MLYHLINQPWTQIDKNFNFNPLTFTRWCTVNTVRYTSKMKSSWFFIHSFSAFWGFRTVSSELFCLVLVQYRTRNNTVHILTSPLAAVESTFHFSSVSPYSKNRQNQYQSQNFLIIQFRTTLCSKKSQKVKSDITLKKV